MAKKFLKVEDVLKRLQDLSEEDSGPEEVLEMSDQENLEHDDDTCNNEEEEFYHNVGIDYEADDESEDDISDGEDASQIITARDGTKWTIQSSSSVRRGPRRRLDVFSGNSRPSVTSQRVIMDQECPADSLKLFLDREMLLRIQVSLYVILIFMLF